MSERSARAAPTGDDRTHAADPQAIEHELERTRTQMEATLEELRQRLSPDELVQVGLHYLRHGAGREYVRNLREDITNNPLPVTFTALGLAWTLLASRPGAQSRTRTSTQPSPSQERRAQERRATAERMLKDRRIWVAAGLALAAGAAAAAVPWARRRRQHSAPRQLEHLEEPVPERETVIVEPPEATPGKGVGMP